MRGSTGLGQLPRRRSEDRALVYGDVTTRDEDTYVLGQEYEAPKGLVQNFFLTGYPRYEAGFHMCPSLGDLMKLTAGLGWFDTVIVAVTLKDVIVRGTQQGVEVWVGKRIVHDTVHGALISEASRVKLVTGFASVSGGLQSR